MKRILLFFLLAFLAKATLAAQTTSTGNVWVVAVGIGHYQNSGILTDLDFPVTGAFQFSLLYEKRQLTYYTPVILTERKARRRDILSMLESTFVNNPELTSEDMIIFYFSGHGEMTDGNIGICPYDYSGDVRDLVTDQAIQDILRRSRARHKVCFIEACKTEAQSADISDPAILENFNRQRRNVGNGLVFITSTEAGKKSWGKADIGGYFTHYLLRGLEGEANANGDAFVTVEELFPFVQNGVKKLTQNQQIPQINDRKGYDPVMPLMVIPPLLPEKPQLPVKPVQPVQEPCVVNQTGEFCVENATREPTIWVRWNGKVIPIQKGYKECFLDVKAGTAEFKVFTYMPGGGSYVPGGAFDYQVQVKACNTVTKVIR